MTNPLVTIKHKHKLMEPTKNISNPISPYIHEERIKIHTKCTLNINPHQHPITHTNFAKKPKKIVPLNIKTPTKLGKSKGNIPYTTIILQNYTHIKTHKKKGKKINTLETTQKLISPLKNRNTKAYLYIYKPLYTPLKNPHTRIGRKKIANKKSENQKLTLNKIRLLPTNTLHI